jgi:multimeric flavodoxin WrbA
MDVMKAVLFNGFGKRNSDAEWISAIIGEELKRKGFEVEKIELRDVNVAACQGCFDCWVKTPGECKIDDDGRTMAKKMVESNLIIHITPITFGGYSSELKKILDRFIPILLPFFTERNGETHHKYRYKQRGSIIAIGVLDKPDAEKEAIFKQLVYRNSLNMGAPVHEAMIYTKTQNKTDFSNDLVKIIQKVEQIT